MKYALTRSLGGLTAVCLLLLPFLAQADPTDAILGDWRVESQDAIIRFERDGDGYQGRIVWQLRNRYGPEDGPELNGKPVVDLNNPDPALRSRTLDGLRMIWDLHYDPDHNEWTGGRVYNSDDGHIYRCRIRMVDPDHLKLRGYFAITLLGGSTVWTRVNSLPPPQK